MERVNRRVFDFTRFILYSSVQRELVSLTPVVAPSLSKEKEGKKGGGSHFVEELTQQDWPPPLSRQILKFHRDERFNYGNIKYPSILTWKLNRFYDGERRRGYPFTMP